MSSKIQSYFNSLLHDVKDFAVGEVEEYIGEAKSDSEDFIKQIGVMSEDFIKMRAKGEITTDEFKELTGDLLDLNKMQYHKLSSAAKVRAQKIVNGLNDLLLNKLVSII